MAELDYAFVADYANVENGKLTAVGASFIDLRAQLPTWRSISVAGRLRAPRDVESIQISIEFDPPGDDPVIVIAGTITRDDIDHQYRDKVAILFSVGQLVPLNRSGLCVVRIRLDDELVRELKFEVSDSE